MTDIHDETGEDVLQAGTSGLEGRVNAKVRLARTPVQFNLDDVKKRLQGESEWQQNGRNQFALFHQGALRVGFFGFKAGAGMQDHKVNGHVTVHVLEGRLEVSAEGHETVTVAKDGFAGWDGMETFTVKALDETYAILTFCQADGVAESARGNDPGTQLRG